MKRKLLKFIQNVFNSFEEDISNKDLENLELEGFPKYLDLKKVFALLRVRGYRVNREKIEKKLIEIINDISIENKKTNKSLTNLDTKIAINQESTIHKLTLSNVQQAYIEEILANTVDKKLIGKNRRVENKIDDINSLTNKSSILVDNLETKNDQMFETICGKDKSHNETINGDNMRFYETKGDLTKHYNHGQKRNSSFVVNGKLYQEKEVELMGKDGKVFNARVFAELQGKEKEEYLNDLEGKKTVVKSKKASLEETQNKIVADSSITDCWDCPGLNNCDGCASPCCWGSG